MDGAETGEEVYVYLNYEVPKVWSRNDLRHNIEKFAAGSILARKKEKVCLPRGRVRPWQPHS